MRIGKLFKLDTGFGIQYYMLCQVAFGKVSLINLESGNRWTEPVEVHKPYDITGKEFHRICNGKYFELLGGYRLTVE